MSLYSHEQLKPALEFAFEVLRSTPAALAKYRLPKAVQHHLRTGRPTRQALIDLRRILEDRDDVRSALGAAVAGVPVDQREGLDDVAVLWLSRPDGWTERLAEVLADRAARKRAERDDVAASAAERRLRGAEAHLERVRFELAEALATADALRADLSAERARSTALGSEVETLSRRVEELNAQVRRLNAGAERAGAELIQFQQRLEQEQDDRAGVEAERADLVQRLHEALVARTEAESALAAEREAARASASHEPDREAAPRAQRLPVPVPGGLLESDVATIDYLVRFPGMTVVVDGYNLSHDIWPDAVIEDQRARLVTALENLVARTSARVRVVFDGAEGAQGWRSERRIVDVEFSPSGTIADDVIRRMVRAMPPDRKVLVVTSDRAVITSVRALGANSVTSSAFEAYLLR